MPNEIETRPTSAGQDRAMAPRGWMVRNERFLRAVCMISVYVFGALCLISILTLGIFAFISGILLGLVLAAALGIVASMKLRQRRSDAAREKIESSREGHRER